MVGALGTSPLVHVDRPRGEPAEPDAVRRAPRRPNQPVLDRMAVERIVRVAVFMSVISIGIFELEQSHGATIEETRTTVLATIVLVQSFYLLDCRSLRQPVREIGLLTPLGWHRALLLLQVAFTYVAFMNVLFHTAPIGPEQWAAAALVASLVLHSSRSRSSYVSSTAGAMCRQREAARSSERA